MDLEKKFKKETGIDAYMVNDLRPKFYNDYYVEWLEDIIIKEKLISCNAKSPKNKVWNPFISVNDKSLKRIEINKSKLEELGFEITPLTNGRNKATKWKIDLFEDEKGIWSFDLGRIYIDINFLHELQNLYFALTGTELEITSCE